MWRSGTTPACLPFPSAGCSSVIPTACFRRRPCSAPIWTPPLPRSSPGVLRWQVEVTFHEVRAHLGAGTQRHWSDRAVARTTPALMGLFSLVTLLAHPAMQQEAPLVRAAAWYTKSTLTFIDALAVVRRSLWAGTTFHTSTAEPDMVKIPRPLMEHLTELLSYAA